MPPSIQTGPSLEPLRIVVTGNAGVGKTTFAAGAPNVLFIDAEGGSGDLDIARIRVRTWDEVMAAVSFAATTKYATIVLDTVDTVERFCWAHLCERGGVDSIEKYEKGYGKGYTAAVELQQRLLSALDGLRAKGMAVIILAHTKIKKFDDPEGAGYDRYQLAMNDKAAELWTSWADAVLFAGLDIRLVDPSVKATEKGKARDEKPPRMLWTEERAAYLAKNRQGLPPSIPLDWKKFATAIRWAERHRLPEPKTEPAKPHPIDGNASLQMLQTAAVDAVKAGWKRADVIELFAPGSAAADVPADKRMAIILKLNQPPANPNEDQPGAK